MNRAGSPVPAPRQKSPGSYTGRARTTWQGRPALRPAARRAVWGALKSNPVYAARLAHLTSREHHKLPAGQAPAALAAALPRHPHAIITTGQRSDPAIAAGGRPGQIPIAARPPVQAARRAGGRGQPTRHREVPTAISAHIPAAPPVAGPTR